MRATAILCSVVMFVASTGFSADEDQQPRTAVEPTGELTAEDRADDARSQPKPVFSPTVASRVQVKLERAYSVAFSRVRDQGSCQSMFARLGSDGAATLRDTLYLPASKARESEVCGSGTVAYTRVGEPVTRLCERFGRVSDDKAAVILLHEALHTAGLDERPHDPDAMSPAEINAMVERSCGLGR